VPEGEKFGGHPRSGIVNKNSKNCKSVKYEKYNITQNLLAGVPEGEKFGGHPRPGITNNLLIMVFRENISSQIFHEISRGDVFK
jgi:hypothetical protein